MDIYCPVDAEPWDHDSLHEEAEASGRTYQEVRKDFQVRGCKALEAGFGPQGQCVKKDSTTASAASAMYELMGDDMDGAAAMMEDFGAMGLLD